MNSTVMIIGVLCCACLIGFKFNLGRILMEIVGALWVCLYAVTSVAGMAASIICIPCILGLCAFALITGFWGIVAGVVIFIVVTGGIIDALR